MAEIESKADEGELLTIKLKKTRLILLTYLQEALLDLGFESKDSVEVDVSAFESLAEQMIVARIKLEIFAEDTGILSIYTPKNWFEMLKANHAPRWLLDRWPVKNKKSTYLARELFPTVPAPGIISRPKFMQIYPDPEYPPKSYEDLPRSSDTINGSS